MDPTMTQLKNVSNERTHSRIPIISNLGPLGIWGYIFISEKGLIGEHLWTSYKVLMCPT